MPRTSLAGAFDLAAELYEQARPVWREREVRERLDSDRYTRFWHTELYWSRLA